MKDLICYCGHDCSRCVTYLATVHEDEHLRRQAQEFYRREFGMEIPMGELRCHGGRSDCVFSLCRACPWVQCCVEKGLKACCECSDYPCRALADYQRAYVNRSNQIP